MSDAPPPELKSGLFTKAGDIVRATKRGLSLVWTTSKKLSVMYGALTLVAAVLPATAAYVGKLIIDAVILAAETGVAEDRDQAIAFVLLEGAVLMVQAGAQRGIDVVQSLLRALLGQRVNEMILEKALTLELAQFEDSELYDKMTRARRQASVRPLSLVNRSFGLVQNVISLVTYGALLLSLSWVAVVILVVAAVPAFLVEAKFSGDAFRLFSWRAPEKRQQNYLEIIMSREDYAKEVKLLGLGDTLLARYHDIFAKLFAEDRGLMLRRGLWGYLLGLLSTVAFYGAYAWIALTTILGRITLGDMTMYLLLFKQGQAATAAILRSVGGMYEDALYLSTLDEFLAVPTTVATGTIRKGSRPDDGVRFENVSFFYPGSDTPAIKRVNLHLRPGHKLALVGENGSGKTTLIKLLAGLYQPTEGQVLLDGTPVQDWDATTLRARLGVIFQDFVRYQLLAGENIGAGDVDRFDDREGWKQAAVKGMAEPIIDALPDGYETQLGRWFKNGRELSGGQWQKVALSRAFMRTGADLLVLDEPTAAMDAEAEAQIFARVKDLSPEQMAILISHRFSTVRMADEIVVLHEGAVLEQGTHESLMADNGKYAHLFSLQAAGYQ